MHPKDADRMANGVDPDQILSSLTWATLFAQAYLSENLGPLWQLFKGCFAQKGSFDWPFVEDQS